MLEKRVYLFLLPILLFALFLGGCSGYQFRRHDNPLSRYNIESLTIPMFVNKSALPNVVGPFTGEIKLLFDSYPDLTVYNGDNSDADAVLIGILNSDDSRRNVLERNAERYTSGDLKDSIGSRREFYLPARTNVELSLRLVLIKKPNAMDRELIQQQQFKKFTKSHPRIIFDQSFDLDHQFSRIIEDTTSLDSGGSVNYVKNHQAVDIGIQRLAKQVRRSFEDVVINVF